MSADLYELLEELEGSTLVPENVPERQRTWCDNCGVWFDYEHEPVSGRRRFCSDDCKAAHHRKLQSNDPDQVAIREYMERMKDHPGWD